MLDAWPALGIRIFMRPPLHPREFYINYLFFPFLFFKIYFAPVPLEIDETFITSPITRILLLSSEGVNRPIIFVLRPHVRNRAREVIHLYV